MSGCNCTAEEISTALATLRTQTWLILRPKIDERTTDDFILSKLLGLLENRFLCDVHGVPRVWKSIGHIDSAFKRGHDEVYIIITFIGITADPAQQALELLQLYSRIPPVDKSHIYIVNPGAARTVLTECKMQELTAKFRHDAQGCYDVVKCGIKPSTVTIPVCMSGILVVLLLLSYVGSAV